MGTSHRLHPGEDRCVLSGVLPFEGEGVRISIGRIGDGDHLVQILGDAGELGKILFGYGAGGFAVMKVGTVRVVVERAGAGDGVGVVRSLGFFGGVAL